MAKTSGDKRETDAATAATSTALPPYTEDIYSSQVIPTAEAHHAMGAHHHFHHEEAQMREDDDTILEFGLSRSSTPVLKALSPPSFGPLSNGVCVPPANGDPDVVSGLTLPGGHPGVVSTVRSGSSILQVGGTCPVEGCQQSQQPGVARTGGIQLPPAPSRRHYRRCLSGDDIIVESFGGSNASDSDFDFRPDTIGVISEEKSEPESEANIPANVSRRGPSTISALSPVSVAEDGSVLSPSSREPYQIESSPTLENLLPQEEEADECHPERVASAASTQPLTAQSCRENPAVAVASVARKRLGRGRRSKSIDRRLNEAAQFAEAVGEVPPSTEEEILRVIIEGDSSSDDDDDDDGTMVSTSEGAVTESIPSMMPSLTPVPKDPPALMHDSLVSGLEAEEADTEKAPSIEESASCGREQQVTDKCVMRKRPWLCKRFDWPPRQQSAVTHHMTLLGFVSDGDSVSDTVAAHKGFRQPGQPYVYRGIHSNPPEITKRGISRGNYAQLHRKAWLEVSDKYHRYGKNLRLYYKHWERLNHPTNMFFDWLDSKGEAAGQPLPNLPECPRANLDSDTVLYITNPEIQARYALDIVLESEEQEGKSNRILVDADGIPVRTGPEGWIFVLRDHVLYGAQKVTSIAGKSKQRFHHSSFFGGKAVAAAGILITDDAGHLTRLYPHSGHYRPGEAHMQRMLFFLQQGGVDLNTFDVDLQQILHVSRQEKDANTPKGGTDEEQGGEVGTATATKKAKKVDSLLLMPALYVACFLAHKARMIGEGIFSQLHKIRSIGATTVQEALDGIDEGGSRKNSQSQME